MADAPLLELRAITKRFPGVLANDDVNFDLRRGEVHALLGENGAGKSTLMNILYGLYTPDSGEILLDGKPIDLGSTKAAIEQGIGMVHQHFMLIPVMTVAENIVLATEPRRLGVLLDYDSARKRVRELSERYGLAVDPDARIDRITVGQQQRVEILKALYRGAEILILDEPTAVLTPQEAAGAVRDHPVAQAAGQVDHLHLAQAERGARDRRPDHDAAPRCRRRHDSGRRGDGRGARAHDGRARGAAARRQDGGAARRAAAAGGEPVRVRRPRPRGSPRCQLSSAGGRDRRPRRRRRERAVRADRRDRRAPPRGARPDRGRRTRHDERDRARGARRRHRRTSRRTATAAASCCRSP